jgi:hypothetical protein
MGIRWRDRWAGQSAWARCALVAYSIGFTEGTFAHVMDLVRGGLSAYSFAPVVVQVFFIGLVVLDPLVVVLVVRMRPAGVGLAGVVMAVDVVANWFVNWSWLTQDPSRLVRPVGLLPITLFGLFVLVSMVPLRRSLSFAGSPAWSGSGCTASGL